MKVAKKENRPVKVTTKHATEMKVKTPFQAMRNAINTAEKKPELYNSKTVHLISTVYQLQDNKATEAEFLELMRK